MMLLHGPSSNSTNISVQRTASAAPSPSSTATAAVVTKKKPTKKESFKRLPSIDEVSTAPTERLSSYGSSSSFRIISRNDDDDLDDLDDFLESLESIYLNDDNSDDNGAIGTEEEDVLSKLMSYEQHTKITVSEQQHHQQQEGVGRADLQTVTNTTDDSTTLTTLPTTTTHLN